MNLITDSGSVRAGNLGYDRLIKRVGLGFGLYSLISMLWQNPNQTCEYELQPLRFMLPVTFEFFFSVMRNWHFIWDQYSRVLRKQTLWDHSHCVKSHFPSLTPSNVTGPRTPAFHVSKCRPIFWNQSNMRTKCKVPLPTRMFWKTVDWSGMIKALTGRPTVELNKASLLTPGFRSTLPLNVSFGVS